MHPSLLDCNTVREGELADILRGIMLEHSMTYAIMDKLWPHFFLISMLQMPQILLMWLGIDFNRCSFRWHGVHSSFLLGVPEGLSDLFFV